MLRLEDAQTSQPNFTVEYKPDSLVYTLTKPTELKAIEITADLYRATFFIAIDKMPEEADTFEQKQEYSKIKGMVSGAVSIPMPEFGVTSSDWKSVCISGMHDYETMPKCNYEHIQRKQCVDEQLHPLEWILTKAKNSGILPNFLYDRIRIDVRNRVRELAEAAKSDAKQAEVLRNEVSESYVPQQAFKQINKSVDVNQFAGKIVAFLSENYYFSAGDNAVIFPVAFQGKQIRFAQIDNSPSNWQGGETGYNMTVFLKPVASGSNNALIDSQIRKDASLAMRLANAQELQFLKTTLQLNQGRLNYRAEKTDAAMLQQLIDLTTPRVELIDEESPSKPSKFSLFAEKPKATIPSFTVHTNGVVDWTRESENKDKATQPKPSRVYIVKGGDLETRQDKISKLCRGEAFSMYGTYYNKDKSECAVVFSSHHDTFNMMNFDLAKQLAGDAELPENFQTSNFGKEARFGVITVNDAPRIRFNF